MKRKTSWMRLHCLALDVLRPSKGEVHLCMGKFRKFHVSLSFWPSQTLEKNFFSRKTWNFKPEALQRARRLSALGLRDAHFTVFYFVGLTCAGCCSARFSDDEQFFSPVTVTSKRLFPRLRPHTLFWSGWIKSHLAKLFLFSINWLTLTLMCTAARGQTEVKAGGKAIPREPPHRRWEWTFVGLIDKNVCWKPKKKKKKKRDEKIVIYFCAIFMFFIETKRTNRQKQERTSKKSFKLKKRKNYWIKKTEKNYKFSFCARRLFFSQLMHSTHFSHCILGFQPRARDNNAIIYEIFVQWGII